MVKYWKSTRRSVQSKIKINHPQKAELQIATLLFLCPFSGYACGNISFTEPAAYGLGKESAMTKHNAEMENSNEKQQPGVRTPAAATSSCLPKNTGEAEADTDTEGAAGSTGAGLCDCRYGEKSSRLHFGSCKAFISVARMIV
ncbi:MAG: hypothetical protein ACLTKQ_01660 [Acutalibacteraceae bacterium]